MAGESILIIDDRADARAWLFEHVLHPAGYVVHEAATLADARARLAAGRFNLIIIDAHLDDNHGLDLLPEAIAASPVIVTTDQPSVEVMSAALAAGARDVLVYPFAPERLARAIKTQLRTAAMLRERDQLREQVERQIQEFNALYTVGKKTGALLDIEESLTLVVSAAVNLTGADEGSLMLRDPDTGELFLRAHYNLSEAAIQTLRVRVNDTLMNRVVQSGRPIMLSGLDLVRSHTVLPVKALLSVPLFAGDRVTGVLTVDNRLNARPFTEHDVHLLSTLADSAAIAIENANLYWQVESERAKLDTILREIEDVVIVTDADLRLILLNNAARRAFNLGEDALGRPLAEAITVPAVQDLFDQRKLRSRNWRAEVVLSDGRTLQGQLSILSGIGYGAVLQDISRLKELDRIKSEFVSIVSHDLRTPLTAIRGYVSLLPRVGPLNDQQREFVQRVEGSMSSIVELISDLLDVGKIEAGVDWEMKPIQLQRIAGRAVEALRAEAERKQQTLTLHAAEVPPTLGHARRLEQVAANLISNAVKYTPPGGQIDVIVREADGFLTLQVRDTGIGIAVDDQRRIFDKFYRVESDQTEQIGGSGLGLTIVKAIVERHAGRVWVESQPGRGSTFTVLLPKLPVNNAS